MKKHLLFSLFCLFFAAASSQAGQSGYISNGKAVVTHKEGVPVEQITSEKGQRKPASVNRVPGALFFEEDDLARCYWLANQSNIQCIRK